MQEKSRYTGEDKKPKSQEQVGKRERRGSTVLGTEPASKLEALTCGVLIGATTGLTRAGGYARELLFEKSVYGFLKVELDVVLIII